MRRIRVDNEIENSKRKFACGIGPALPEGDTYVFMGELEHTVDCPGCNGGIQRHLGTPISELSGRPDHRGFDKFCEIAAPDAPQIALLDPDSRVELVWKAPRLRPARDLASGRLAILNKSLEKKKASLARKFDEHFVDVKSANGQPLNDKRNGASTTARWDLQSDSIRNLQEGIAKTERAIERERELSANVDGQELPKFLADAVASGELKQWRKHPNFFFVTNVDKGRIIWDAERQGIVHRYADKIPVEQFPQFRDTFNKLSALSKANRAAALPSPAPGGEL